MTRHKTDNPCLLFYDRISCKGRPVQAVVLNEPLLEKTGFFYMQNKDADQLCSDRTADQRLWFPYIASTTLLSKSEISSH